jgi:hypothetical protein
MWPAIVSLGALAMVRHSIPVSLLACAAAGTAVAVLYLALFAGVAIGGDDRRRYVAKIQSLLPRRLARPPVPVLATTPTEIPGRVTQ